MKATRGKWACAFLMVAVLAMPAAPSSCPQARDDYAVQHIFAFSDGKTEKTVSLGAPGTDRNVSITLPNGARVVSASMNISSMPGADPVADYLENLTIDVGKDGALEYAFCGTGFGRMGYQRLFSTGASVLNATTMLNGYPNATPSVRLPKNATVSKATLSVGGSRIGAAGRLLLLGATGLEFMQDIQTKLMTYPDVALVDCIEARNITPSLENLTRYDSVLVWSDGQFKDNETLGNNLANYTDLGGGVVIASLCYALNNMGLSPGGRFRNGGYQVLPNAGNQVNGGSLGLYDASHPLMTNVKSFVIPYFRPATTSITPGTTIVATYTDGIPLVATKEVNGVTRVDIGFCPPSSDVAPGVGWDSGTDGKHIIYNAMAYAGRRTVSCSLDVGNDGGIDYHNPALNTTQTTQDVSSQINAYLSKAQPTGTDAYGNQYVDVPLAVSSNATITVPLSNLSIVYQYTTTVDPNPANGNLAGGLNAVIPARLDGKSTNIPVAIFSNHSGKLKLSNLRIDYVPPVHPAIIKSRTPEESAILMDENTTVNFCITAVDPYDYPINASWTVDGKTSMTGAFNFSFCAGFDSNGTHNVTVTVDNGLQKVATSWQVAVRNVNRLPVIDYFSPEKKHMMDENSSAIFEISASDPDNDALDYTWHLDGKRVLSNGTGYEYNTTYSSAGKHELKVAVEDILGGSTTLSWDITVTDVNIGPMIADFSPPGDEASMPENSSTVFGIVDISPDGDKQTVRWSLDGIDTGTTQNSFTYSADFNSSGTHVIQAEVTDQKLSARKVWTVFVADLNRAPIAIISSPAARAVFLSGADIVLDGSNSSDPDDDQLTMTWSEEGKPLGTGSTLSVKLARGTHIITLAVGDGKNNGNATAQVEIYVSYIDFKCSFSTNIAAPVEGDNIVVTARLTNKGDGSVYELPVTFIVDGTIVSNRTIKRIEPDSVFPLQFQWKAMKGDHNLEVKVNDQDFSKTVAVAGKSAVAAPVGGDMMPLVAVAAIVVVALAAVFAVVAKRKGRTAVRRQDGGRAAERPEEAKAREAIGNLERIIKDAESAGLDTARARRSLKLAQNSLDKGKYDGALVHCQNAENSIE